MKRTSRLVDSRFKSLLSLDAELPRDAGHQEILDLYSAGYDPQEHGTADVYLEILREEGYKELEEKIYSASYPSYTEAIFEGFESFYTALEKRMDDYSLDQRDRNRKNLFKEVRKAVDWFF